LGQIAGEGTLGGGGGVSKKRISEGRKRKKIVGKRIETA